MYPLKKTFFILPLAYIYTCTQYAVHVYVHVYVPGYVYVYVHVYVHVYARVGDRYCNSMLRYPHVVGIAIACYHTGTGIGRAMLACWLVPDLVDRHTLA